MILINTDIKVGEIMSEMMCGTNVGVPSRIRDLMWNGKKSLYLGGVVWCIGTVKAMKALKGNMARFMAYLTNRTSLGIGIILATMALPL